MKKKEVVEMHYGSTLFCLNNYKEWIKIDDYEVNGKKYHEYIIASGFDIDGNPINETTVIPEIIIKGIITGDYSFFINPIYENKITIYNDKDEIVKYDVEKQNQRLRKTSESYIGSNI